MKRKILVCTILIFMMFINIVYANECKSNAEIVLDELGIMTPSDKETITRKEMAEIFVRFLKAYDGDSYRYVAPIESDEYAGPFVDFRINPEEETGVSYLYHKRIIKGDGNGHFRPDDTCTYGEMAAMLVRSLGWDEYYTGGCGLRGLSFPDDYVLFLVGLNVADNSLDANETNIYDVAIDAVYRGLFTPKLIRLAHSPVDSFASSPCPLEQHLGLEYKQGVAKSVDGGIEIDGELYLGSVYDTPDFEEGKVLCIYEVGEDGTKKIKICVEEDWQMGDVSGMMEMPPV